MTTTLTRILLFTTDAAALATALAATADQPLPAPRDYVRLDGSTVPRWTIPLGDVEIDVQQGDDDARAMLVLTVADAAAAIARLTAAGFTVKPPMWGEKGSLKVGGALIKLVSAA